MSLIAKILEAIVGYTGSSQNPSAMSLRFTAIIAAGFSMLVGVASALGLTLPFNTTDTQMLAASFGLVASVIAWLIGLVRYVWATVNPKRSR